MPKKTFVAGEVLTAAEVNEYLMDQAVMTFAGTAARGSAIASPSEGMFTFLEDTDVLEYYDGSAWVEFSPASDVPGDNLIYNGAMQVAQRGTSSTGVSSAGYYTADRWRTSLSSLGTWTQTVETDAPTGSGFATSLKMEVTTADAAPAASDFAHMEQRLEGYDVQSIKKGSSSAESLTLSMWVKSDTTGNYVVSLYDGTNTRSISGSYSISSADTWEYKTIIFPPDTTGAFNADNSVSLRAWFWLAAGSDRTSGTLQTAWGANVNANLAVGQTNLAASTGNYWQVTGVQLEVGAVASPFEHKPYGVELAECQRYCQTYPSSNQDAIAMGYSNTTTTARFQILYPVTMRAAASLTTVNSSYTQWQESGGPSGTFSNLALSATGGPNGASLDGTSTGLTQHRPLRVWGASSGGVYPSFILDAEL